VTRTEQETTRLFAERYRVPPAEVSRRVELAVIGADWGVNGYTTAAQADLLGRELGLRPGTRLLDLGAGRGWPGLYLAATTGCQLVLSDVPIEALQAAAARARSERLSGRATPMAASARALPFARAAFDAVVHTDVLC
jgi:SAM-dependent methyltransferase